MPTKLEGQCARQECCIHEQTLSEWQIIGHRSRLVENESGGRIRAGNAVAGETYCDIRKVKRGLIDCDAWCSGRLGREGDLPGTFAIAAVLNETAAIFIIVLAAIVLKDRLRPVQLVGSAAAIAGVFLVVWQ